ncbi:prenyltransferase [Motiliproteus sediminis]|uniref:prenyltransferase n=1 Tax=Motiliproteus sediminis TaxID=1468178 RepID=UPI001AEF3760|nr:prenyltransferase [Motiliproteus sediminis]
MDVARYRFSRALRPFSLVVALISCGLGIALALADSGPLWAAAVTLLAGVLLQSGVNLINDHSDLHLLPASVQGEQAAACIRRNHRIGLGLFVVVGLLALPLLWHAGWPLLLLALIGLVGAIGYTQEPINYKRRGLGVPLVFWLMGVLMVCGAYLAVAGSWRDDLWWRSLPVACLTALLLLSNELRDWEEDSERGIRTLCVRWGYEVGRSIYLSLLGASLLLPLAMALAGQLERVWLLLPVLLLVPALIRLTRAEAAERIALTPLTGRFMALTGVLYIAASLQP